MNFDSRFSIGEKVLVKIVGGEADGVEIPRYVRAVTFSQSKVRYSVLVLGFYPPDSKVLTEGMGTTLHNLDSTLLHPFEGEAEMVEFGFDNYS